MSSETPLVDKLLETHEQLQVQDKSLVETKLKGILEGGHQKLQLIVDFDNTLTRYHKNGVLTDCSWGVMENSPLLPKTYTDQTNSAYDLWQKHLESIPLSHLCAVFRRQFSRLS